MKKKKILLINVIFALTACSSSVNPDVNTMVPELGLSSNDQSNIAIINQSTVSIRFLIGSNGGDLTEAAIGSGQKSYFSCSACGGRFYIALITGETRVEHELAAGNLYAIRPDFKRKVYDIFLVQ